jgi:hypothetical protein
MIIHLADGDTIYRTWKPSMLVGYVAERFELTADDLNNMVDLFELDRAEFRAALYQWQARFAENRVGYKPPAPSIKS